MYRQSYPLLTLSLVATAALTAERFVTAAGAVPAAGAACLGVTRSDTAIGDLAPVDVMGTTVVIAGAAIAANAAIETDNQGRAITLDSGVKLARLAPGESAAAAGDPVEVILIPS